MSLCGAGQVLLTHEAYKVIYGRVNRYTPQGARFALVGLYRYKGVKDPVRLYAVGIEIEALQPPKSNAKAKRIGGPKRIRSRARDRKLKEWALWFTVRLTLLSLGYIIAVLWPCLSSSTCRALWGLDSWFWWVQYITDAREKALDLWSFING